MTIVPEHEELYNSSIVRCVFSDCQSTTKTQKKTARKERFRALFFCVFCMDQSDQAVFMDRILCPSQQWLSDIRSASCRLSF